MFWKYNTTSSSQIDTLLAKEDVTLQEVMDSEDIISECRVQNKNLIDFLLRPEVMEELVTLTTREPSIELSEKTRFKYPNIASELLTCDVPSINERLASDERLLEKLYVFLESEPPLNPLLASYFSKIMGALIAKKTEQNWLSYQLTCLQVLDFLKARDTFLPLLIKHLGTSAIMDLMLKLMTQVEGAEMRQNILNWLDSQRIIQQLVSLLNPKIEKERHDNVAQLLCDFVRTARDNFINMTERADPDPLLNSLESSETMVLLLDQMFDKEKCDSSIVGGIQVLLCLLDVNQASVFSFRSTASMAASIAASLYSSNINETVDTEQKQKIVVKTTDAICGRLKDFHDLLLNPPKQSPVITTVGQLDRPLGNTRLQVVKLLAAVVPSNYQKLNDELIALGTFPVLLDLFFEYVWNNFLHTQVENCVVAALNACVGGDSDDVTPSPLCKHLLDSCNLIERILKAWKENDEQQTDVKSIRKGYMGHLISMVNKIVELCKSTSLGKHLTEIKLDAAKALEEFKDSTLADVNREQEILLGGCHPDDSNIDDEDLGDSSEFGDLQLQESFTQYQMQNTMTQYIDGYSGFNDDAFNDGEDTLQTIDNPSDVNFDLSESDMAQGDEIFKQVCAQSINTLFDSDDQIFEDKEHTFQTVIEKHGGDKNDDDVVYNSSDSDDENQSGEDNMDIDPWSASRSDPWNSLANASSDAASTGWADFNSAAFVETPVFDAAFSATDNATSTSIAEKEQEKQSQDAENVIAERLSGQSADVAEIKCDTKPVAEIKCDTKPVAEGSSGEKSAASGDHGCEQRQDEAKTEEQEASSGSQQQPSMSLEGDCKSRSEKPPNSAAAEPTNPPNQTEKV